MYADHFHFNTQTHKCGHTNANTPDHTAKNNNNKIKNANHIRLGAEYLILHSEGIFHQI